MMYLGDFPADQAIYFMWNTNDSSGGSITRAADGTLSVYKDNSDGTSFDQTQVTTGITNDEDVDGLTGVHSCCITTTNAWYETGHDYVVVLSASTIDGETVNAVIAHFSIENRLMRGTDSASTHSAADIWSVGTRALTDKSGFALSTAGLNAIWDDLIAGMTAVGSIGKLIADNLNATMTSRAPANEYNTQMGYIPANLGDVPIASELNSAHGAGSWATATGFNTTTPPTVIEIRQEMDANSTRMDADISSRSPANEYDERFEDVRSLLKSNGDIFYVSKIGDNSDGTTWAKAKTTIDAAIALCAANHGDKIYIAPGTYDETAGGIAGVTCDVEGIWIRGILPGVTVKNTNTTNAGKVFTVTANNTLISDIFAEKGETTSDNSIVFDVNGSGIVADIRNVTISVDKSNHTGIRFTGGAVSCSYMDDDLHLSHIYSNTGNGIGIEFGSCIGCVVVDPQIHDLDYGMKFTGGANCHHNTVSPSTVIASCTTGISLDAAAWSNILSALILNCTTHYVDNSGVDTNDTDGSLTFVLDDIKASIVAASPQTHLATSDSTVTYGTVDSGTYEDTNTDNDTYWQISPDAVNALDMYSQFLIGTGRTPNAVDFNGRFQSHVARYCEVDAWNYDTSAWETVSSDSNRIGHATSDFDRQFALTCSHVKAADGEMKIRVRSTSTDTGDDLYIDKLTVASVAQAAGGLTADAVASTVWNRHTDTLTGSNTTGSRLRRLVAVGTEISVSDTATSFTIASGETTADAYKGMLVRVGCSTEDYCETRRIIDWTAGRVITLDRALSSVPQVGDLVRIMNQYGNVDITESGDIDAIKAKTDNLPSGIGQNEALAKFDVFMVLSTDHVTGAAAKTVTGMISKDGGAFAAITNTITEVSDGMYTIASGFTQAEMNADVITLKFVADGCDTRIITIYTS